MHRLSDSTEVVVPFSAVVMNEKVAGPVCQNTGKIGVFGHGYTYSGHPVAAAVALETLKIYEERDIIRHVRKVAPAMQDGLRALADHPLVGEGRGIGLIGAVEMVRNKATRAKFDARLQLEKIDLALDRAFLSVTLDAMSGKRRLERG